MELGRFKDAIDDFSFVIAHEPKIAGYYDNRENAYRQSGMLEQALKDANTTINLAPQYSFAFRGRANVYNDMGKYDLAIQDYDQAVKLAPEDGGLFIDRGKIFRSQSKLDQAISDFSHALDLDSKRWMAGYRERGFAYNLLGQTKNAVADLTAYNSLAPGRSRSGLGSSDFRDPTRTGSHVSTCYVFRFPYRAGIWGTTNDSHHSNGSGWRDIQSARHNQWATNPQICRR